MIKSKKDYKYYLEADRVSKAIPHPNFKKHVKDILLSPDYIWEFQKTLRKLEYYKNCKKGIFGLIGRYFVTRKFRKISLKLGFSIPPNVFGPGLSIAHYGTIVINGATKIGANCRIHTCVNIGTQAGYSGLNKAPTIGNNCYIGPGTKIYGDINIPNGTAIGANSVVNKSFYEENIAIAGVPAKKIADVDTTDFLIPATMIIELGYNKRKDFFGLPASEIKNKIESLNNLSI